ncbi:MAG TPA: uroporphyrinogen-III synthase [Rhizomicrobium sp.]|jgi:uroporphyrinogen-III synthase|nr:uroporphyrinogen-III synthase [Rhizomicrobium sp.]
MRVLVTRPAEDASRTARMLARLGHDALIAPLLELRFLDGPEISLAGVQAILATSGNGIRALARRSPRRDIPVFAVGTQTADLARAESYFEIVDAAGDSRALAALVRGRLRPDAGVLLHAAGTDSRDEWREQLRSAGFEVRRSVLYQALEAPELPAAAQTALRSGSIDALIVFSPRSAQIFADCVQRAGLASTCAHVTACCISDTAAGALKNIPFAAIHVAAHPDHDAVLALLDNCARRGGL